ncbi:HpcH/HpaI aldolase family protein [Iningainema tapete]|uniref:2,4-dihydroxyhept-2-ene-1,7-dioic acid aldolase n=1 Tax=Iningainema tapete BLCC-T55 TaxID=2748662 RepID=A0A8J7CDK6_9CYAN|nr:aldolase/citrate lyase family protein [Iningainema tapete]MBD2772890.1 2,4-dihydroxyhept-2-ene-1,7-dioic acid aldolase [Iningainema tapete BLCC-T55]
MVVNFKQRLNQLETLIGVVITLPCSETAEALSKLEFDWFWIDMEHGVLSLETVQLIMQATGDRCANLVRVPGNDSIWIKRVLDTGCDGIIVPHVMTPEEVKYALDACLYPPQGSRSVGSGRAQNYGMSSQEYLKTANEKIVVVLQIEHIDAVKNIESIIDVPGFDAIIVGPFDLSASMGLIGQVNHPDVQKAIGSVQEACLHKKIPIGIFTADTQNALSAKKAGFSLIGVGVDTMYLWRAAKQTLEEINSI